VPRKAENQLQPTNRRYENVMNMKRIVLAVCMMLLTMSISAKTLVVADKKIVVLSDPHVMAPKLLVSEGEAWTNYLSSQRKMVDYSKSLFDEMVAKIKEEIKPDLVLITGDLTKDGDHQRRLV